MTVAPFLNLKVSTGFSQCLPYECTFQNFSLGMCHQLFRSASPRNIERAGYKNNGAIRNAYSFRI